MNLLKEGWFNEVNDLWPGISQALKIERVLFDGVSNYQHIQVFQTNTYGRMLVLDGIIQCTEKDEFSYQEMISFLPLCSHPNPKSVLIVGGGDGGVAREVSKFPGVHEIHQIEIDEKVIEVSKKYLPFMAKGLSNPKVTLFIGDGYEYLKRQSRKYDIIITDSSDPIGPAAALFEMSYFHSIKNSLNPNGILCSQAGTVWSNLDQVKDTFSHCKALFPNSSYGFSSVPTYPTGQIGFILASLNPDTDFQKPCTIFSEEELEEMNLKYYNDKIHKASFTLPRFVEKEFSKI